MTVANGDRWFFVDGAAWTCPVWWCHLTFRSTAPTPARREAQRRAVRDSHKCKPRPELLKK